MGGRACDGGLSTIHTVSRGRLVSFSHTGGGPFFRGPRTFERRHGRGCTPWGGEKPKVTKFFIIFDVLGSGTLSPRNPFFFLVSLWACESRGQKMKRARKSRWRQRTHWGEGIGSGLSSFGYFSGSFLPSPNHRTDITSHLDPPPPLSFPSFLLDYPKHVRCSKVVPLSSCCFGKEPSDEGVFT